MPKNHLPQESPIEQALEQKREYLKKTDQTLLDQFNTQISALLPKLKDLPKDQQKKLADRIKNFQISEKRRQTTLTTAIESLLQNIIQTAEKTPKTTRISKSFSGGENSRSIKIANPKLDGSDKSRYESGSAGDSDRQENIQQQNLENFNATIEAKLQDFAPLVSKLSVPSTREQQDAFIQALGEKLGANLQKWRITYFEKEETNKQPSIYYRRRYYINYNNELTSREIQKRETINNAAIRDGFSKPGEKSNYAREKSLLSQVDGSVIETITADIELPSPEALASTLYDRMQTSQNNLMEIQRDLGEPYLELRNLASYYIAEQQGAFNSNEIKALRFLEKVIVEKYNKISKT